MMLPAIVRPVATLSSPCSRTRVAPPVLPRIVTGFVMAGRSEPTSMTGTPSPRLNRMLSCSPVPVPQYPAVVPFAARMAARSEHDTPSTGNSSSDVVVTWMSTGVACAGSGANGPRATTIPTRATKQTATTRAAQRPRGMPLGGCKHRATSLLPKASRTAARDTLLRYQHLHKSSWRRAFCLVQSTEVMITRQVNLQPFAAVDLTFTLLDRYLASTACACAVEAPSTHSRVMRPVPSFSQWAVEDLNLRPLPCQG